MAVPYHTHTFDIPVATNEEAAEGTISNKVIVPSNLGTAAVENVEAFATSAQGDLADSSVQPGDLGTAAYEAATAFASAAQGATADSAVQPGDLSTVATSGEYGDLSGTPTLGTAAAENVGYFGTAAQGALADTAVQPAALAAVAPALSADTMLVDNAAGTARESRTLKAVGELLGKFDTLADLESTNVLHSLDLVYIVERVAGKGGGAWWKREASEPDLPALAKTQDATGDWWSLSLGGVDAQPEMFGAEGGFIIEAETRAIFNATSTKQNKMVLRLMDRTIQRLKRTSLWGKLPEFYMIQHNLASMGICWTTPTRVASAVGSLSYIAGSGIKMTAAPGYMLSDTNLGAVAGYSQNDMHVGVFVSSGSAVANATIAAVGGAADINIVMSTASTNQMQYRSNTKTTSNSTKTFSDASGHGVLTRSASGTYQSYRNGSYLQDHAVASTGEPDVPLRIGHASTLLDHVISAAHAGPALTWAEVMALNWIIRDYLVCLPGAIALGGDPVTAAELDAALAIDVDENTAAMHDFIEYVSNGRAKGKIGPHTYVVNETLRPVWDAYLNGERGLSRIRMADGVGYNHPVVQLGDVDEPSWNVHLSNFIVDFNLSRVSGSAGSAVNSVPMGTALSICHANRARIKGVDCYDAYKHCIDVSGSTYGRTGVSLNEGVYSSQLAQDVIVEDCIMEGAGDDGFTTHMCKGVLGRDMKVRFNRAGFTVNSNAFEIDDFSRDVTLENCQAMFAYIALEIKGHEDAKAARNIRVTGFTSLYTSSGVVCRHLNFGEGTTSPSAYDVHLDDIVVRYPLAWAGGDVRQAMRIYAYSGIHVGSVTVIQEDALGDYYGTGTDSDGVVGILNEGRNITFGLIKIEGFAGSNGVRITDASAGYIIIEKLMVIDGPLIALYFSGGSKLVLGTYALNGTSAVGSIGISAVGVTANFKYSSSAGFIEEYATATSIS